MPKLNRQQIDRGLTLVESVVALATDVWKHHKQRRLAGRVAKANSKPTTRRNRGRLVAGPGAGGKPGPKAGAPAV